VATAPTIGSNVEEIVYKNIKFVMWDIGGQEAVRSSWTTYYVNTHVRPPPPHPPPPFPSARAAHVSASAHPYFYFYLFIYLWFT
jgi:hypothetical protein